MMPHKFKRTFYSAAFISMHSIIIPFPIQGRGTYLISPIYVSRCLLSAITTSNIMKPKQESWIWPTAHSDQMKETRFVVELADKLVDMRHSCDLFVSWQFITTPSSSNELSSTLSLSKQSIDREDVFRGKNQETRGSITLLRPSLLSELEHR